LGFSANGVKGFVREEELPFYLQLNKLRIGQVAMFRVKERTNSGTRVIKLSGYIEMDGLDDGNEFTAKHLMPGTIVQVQPEKVVFDGIFVGLKNGKLLK
jgi:hypothetical protein